MGAYSKVDPAIRRKLEEMLHTWKQPVPNSSSTSPVFSSEVTRKIDNALIKARTAALQHQQKQMKQAQDPKGFNRPGVPTPPPQQFRNTPPLLNGSAQQYPNGQGYDYGQNGLGAYNRSTVGEKNSHQNYSCLNSYFHVSQPVMNHPTPPPPAGMPSQLPLQQTQNIVSPVASVDSLHSDINSLIKTSQKRFAEDPVNQEIQKRLKALLDLQTILQTQQLPPAQLAMVREQVKRLANPTPPPAMPVPPPPPPPPPPPQVQLPFSTQDLAALLATATQKPPMNLPPPPPPPPPASVAQGPPPLPLNFPPTGPDTASLIASLQKAGLLPGMVGNAPPSLPPPPPLPSALPPFLFPPPGGNFIPPPLATQTPPRQGKLDWRSIDVEMKSMSLKM